MKKKRFDWQLFCDLSVIVVLIALCVMHEHQARRIDELWKQIDVLNARPTVTTDGAKTEVKHVR